MGKTLDRRAFLKNSAGGILGAGLIHQEKGVSLQGRDESRPLKIREYRTLGRTGFKVSDISCGYVNVPEILDRLLDAGVNYIDTAESYRNEQIVGEVIKKRDRKKLFITTKLYFKEDEGKKKFLERASKCMERLQTDYLDCVMIHESPSIDILNTKGFHEAMNELKAEGRVRFLGISNHGVTYAQNQKESMEKVLLAAAVDGRFDVFLLVYNFLQQKNGERVLSVCRQQKIGTTLMKVNPAKHYYWMKNNIETKEKEGKEIPDGSREYFSRLEELMKRVEPFTNEYDLQNPVEIRDAAIRFCLSNPDVNTVCLEFSNFDLLNNYLGLSGTRLSSPEQKKLDVYSKIYGSLYCRHGCNVCEAECPHNVPINTIMRFNHYFEAHGREKRAMIEYEHLQSTKADICQKCGGICETTCPFGVPIRDLLVHAHGNLAFV